MEINNFLQREVERRHEILVDVAGPKEIGPDAKLLNQYRQEVGLNFNPSWHLDLAVFPRNPDINLLTWIATWHSSMPVGFAIARELLNAFDSSPSLLIEDLYVDTEFRNLGVGHKLLMSISSYADANDYEQIDLAFGEATLEGIEFYEREGFKVRRLFCLGQYGWSNSAK